MPGRDGDLQSARQIDGLVVAGLQASRQGQGACHGVRIGGELEMGRGQVGVFGITVETVFCAADQSLN